MDKERIHFFSIKGRYFAYDIPTTNCFEINEIALSVLPEIISGNSESIEKKYGNVYSKPSLRKCIKECKNILNIINFYKETPAYRHPINSQISSVCLHISHKCNLACEYCYADAGTFGEKGSKMDHDIMIKAVDFTFANSGDSDEINIGFFGGEPLLNFKLMQECVKYAKAKASELNKNVTFAMTSNAVLLTKEKMKFLKDENFSLLFSLDGPRKIHDRMRKFTNSTGSFKYAYKNIKEYFNNYSKYFTIRGTFTKTTPNFLDQVLFLNREGFRSISVEPAQLFNNSPHSITSNKEILRIKLEYDKLADAYLESIYKGKPISFFHFDKGISRILNPQPSHTECGAGCGFISIIPDGRIFPCFESVVEKENCIGHINTDFDNRKRQIFQQLQVDKKKECKNCWIKYFCGGGCHAFNIRYNNNIRKPYKPHCELIKYRFKLSAWILSEIIAKGDRTFKNLEKHLQNV